MFIDYTQISSNTYTTFVFKQLVPAAIIFFVGWLLAGKLTILIKRTMIKYKLDESVVSFTNSLLKVIFRGLVILMVASCFGVNISSIIAALGAALVTVGLALKDNLANAASGVIIITSKPFKIGDTLETKDVQGKVTKIEMLFTTLTTPDNKEIVIPNSNLTSSYIINSTTNSKRRIDISLPVNKATKLSDIQPLFEKLIKNRENVLQSPAPRLEILNFDDERVTILVSVWCKSENYDALEKSLHKDMKNEFDIKN